VQYHSCATNSISLLCHKLLEQTPPVQPSSANLTTNCPSNRRRTQSRVRLARKRRHLVLLQAQEVERDRVGPVARCRELRKHFPRSFQTFQPQKPRDLSTPKLRIKTLLLPLLPLLLLLVVLFFLFPLLRVLPLLLLALHAMQGNFILDLYKPPPPCFHKLYLRGARRGLPLLEPRFRNLFTHTYTYTHTNTHTQTHTHTHTLSEPRFRNLGGWEEEPCPCHVCLGLYQVRLSRYTSAAIAATNSGKSGP
jgi:hypothetical protein